MKKLMTVLLAAALVLTAVFAFTACGDAEDAPGTANAGSTSAAEDKPVWTDATEVKEEVDKETGEIVTEKKSFPGDDDTES